MGDWPATKSFTDPTREVEANAKLPWGTDANPKIVDAEKVRSYIVKEMSSRIMMIDGATAKLENGRYKGDHRLSRDEWENALPMIRRAGATWADSIALREATAEDFDVIDRNHGGFIDLQEFCEWVEHAEKRANDGRGNAKGVELGVNEPVDAAGRFVFDSDRKWFTTPLEMRPGNASRKQMEAGQEYGHHRVRF